VAAGEGDKGGGSSCSGGGVFLADLIIIRLSKVSKMANCVFPPTPGHVVFWLEIELQ
jgi:hypothetical protein